MYTCRYIYVYRSILCKACGFGGGHNSDPSSPRYQPVSTSDVYEGEGLSSTRQAGPATAKELELAQFQRMAGIDTNVGAGGAGGLYHLSSSSKNQQKKGTGSMVYADLDDDDLDDAYDTLPTTTTTSTANTTGVYTTNKPPAVKGMSLTGGGPKKSTSLIKPPPTTTSTTNTITNNTTNKVSYLADEEDSDDFDFDNKFSGQVKTVAAPVPKAKSGLKPISKK